jgi:hypothetical protein
MATLIASTGSFRLLNSIWAVRITDGLRSWKWSDICGSIFPSFTFFPGGA